MQKDYLGYPLGLTVGQALLTPNVSHQDRFLLAITELDPVVLLDRNGIHVSRRDTTHIHSQR